MSPTEQTERALTTREIASALETNDIGYIMGEYQCTSDAGHDLAGITEANLNKYIRGYKLMSKALNGL